MSLYDSRLYNPHTDKPALSARLAVDEGRRVVCYCAAWCRTCDAWHTLFERLAQKHADWTFIWVDIEDNPEWLGDEDVEDFPTLLIQDATGTRFWGPQPPMAEALQRLLEHAGQLPVLHVGPGRVEDF